MSVEVNPNYPSDLDSSIPTASDFKAEGDDHIRNIKRVMKATFPNVTAAVTATATQINSLAASGGLFSVGTSTSSLTVGTGTQSFTTQASLGFAVGQSIKITSNADVTVYMTGTCTAYNSTTGAMSVSVTAVGGAGTAASWSITVNINTAPSIVRSARTSNTVIGTADNGTLIDITSGTFTQTFSAVAALGSGWYCYIRNSGTGDVTLDPNASETIDGLTSFVMYPGEVRLVQCDGASLVSVVVQGFSKAFTTSGTFTKPPGYSKFDGFVMSAGQSGGGGGASASGVGGTGGSRIAFQVAASTVPSTVTVTVGAGGVGPAGTTGAIAAAVSGGVTSFGTLVTSQAAANYQGVIVAAAGTGAASVATNTTGTQPSAAAGGGGGGSGGANTSGAPTGPNAGGAGGLSNFAGAGGAGGASGLANGNSTTGVGVAGQDGAAPGGGGGGGGSAGFNTAFAGGAGGSGARGELTIWGVV